MQFRRTSIQYHFVDILTIIALPEPLFCEWTGEEHAYGVQVTNKSGRLIGFYDLDGAELRDHFTSRGVSVAEDPIPSAVIDAVAFGWESGGSIVVEVDA